MGARTIAAEVRDIIDPMVCPRVLLCDSETDVIVSEPYGVVFLTSHRLVTGQESRGQWREIENRGRTGKLFEFSGRDITDQLPLGLCEFSKGILGPAMLRCGQ